MKALLDHLDLLDHLGREEQLAPQVLSAPLDDLDLRGPLELRERRECQERKVLLVQVAVTASKAQLVSQALLDLQVLLERMETRVRLESQDKRAVKDPRENMVLLVHPGQWVLLDSLVQLVLMVRQVLEVNRDHLALREMKGQEGSQDLQAPSDCRVCQAQLEKKERREMLVHWVLLVPQVHVVQLVPMVLMVLKVLQEVWVIQVPLERRVSRVNPDHLESEESQEKWAREESVVRRERLGSRAHLVLLVEKDPMEMTDPKETLVLLVSLVIPVPLVKLDHEAKMVQRETEERMENKEKLVHLDQPVRTDHLDLQEREVLQAQGDRRVVRERKEARGIQVPLALQERPAPWGHRVSQESQELRV